jgi:hypothetical protein
MTSSNTECSAKLTAGPKRNTKKTTGIITDNLLFTLNLSSEAWLVIAVAGLQQYRNEDIGRDLAYCQDKYEEQWVNTIVE